MYATYKQGQNGWNDDVEEGSRLMSCVKECNEQMSRFAGDFVFTKASSSIVAQSKDGNIQDPRRHAGKPRERLKECCNMFNQNLLLHFF